MPDFPSRTIQQQMYTRERRGIFRSAEGFDTVARSSGLRPPLSKGLCIPLPIRSSCRADGTKREGSGGLSGRPSSVPYGNRRNGAGAKRVSACGFYGTSQCLLRITMSFRTVSLKMSIRLTSPGRRLPLPITTILKKALICRAFLPFRFRPNLKPPFPIRGRQPYCRSLGSTRRYSSNALCMHIRGRREEKGIYRSDVPVEQLSAKAEQLFVLFGRLPHAARQVLGFVTYAKEPQSKKGLHLMFVEKGDLRLSDQRSRRIICLSSRRQGHQCRSEMVRATLS